MLFAGLFLFLFWYSYEYSFDFFHQPQYNFRPLAYAAAVAAVMVLVIEAGLFPWLLRNGRIGRYSFAVGLLVFVAYQIPLPPICDCRDQPFTVGWFYPVVALLSTLTLSLLARLREPPPGVSPSGELLQKDAELKYLRDQVNPHFLFNTLNSIYALAKQQSEQTPEVVHQLSTLLRYQLESAQLETVSLRKELDFIQDYLLLEDTRLGDRCRIEFELSRRPARFLIYPMLLLPFVENAFKHGANASREESYIRVAAEVGEGSLDFVVENSRMPGTAVAGTGTGLVNVKRRLAILYPGRHTLRIEKEDPNRYFIHLSLQLHAA